MLKGTSLVHVASAEDVPVVADLGLLDAVFELLHCIGVDFGEFGINALVGSVDEDELRIRDRGSLTGARNATKAVGINRQCVA